MNQSRYDMLKQFMPKYYQLDSRGVFSVKCNRYIEIRTSSSRRHPYVTLCSKYVHQRPQKYPMHEIVGFYKFGERLIDMTIDHKNNNPNDYSWDNLQLMTVSANAKKQENSYIHLAEAQVKEIKNLLNDGLTQQAIADMYGVRRPLISKIKLGTRWKEVTK